MAQIGQQTPYIPETDSGARQWLNNFAAIVANDPAAVGLVAADASTLTALADAYDALFNAANNPITRTSGVIADKDAARNQAVETFRVYAQQIKRNAGVSDQQKLDLGIHLDDSTLTPIPAPVTAPLLAVVSAESGLHTLRYADSQTPASRRKPPGAIQLLLYVAIEDQPTADPGEALFVGAFTKQPFQVAFEPENAGKTATYFARWQTRTGLVGPWSLPVAMQISFGGPVELQSAE